MPSLPDESAARPASWTPEHRVPVRALGALGTRLAAGLGAAGIGGARIESLLRDAVEARCVTCAIAVSGAELAAAARTPDDATDLPEKQRRLRLGYCARETCGSDYYTVRLLPAEGVDWAKVWAEAEPGLQGPSDPLTVVRTGPSFTEQVLKLVMDSLRPLKRPLPLALIAVLLVGLWIRAGWRVPGISPPRRVFIVPSDSASKPTPPPPKLTPGK